MTSHFKEDISFGLECAKISFFNDINDLEISSSFTYTIDSILGSDSCIEDFESVPFPCDCENNCSLNCPCASSIAAGKLVEVCSNDDRKPIMECSILCKCDILCTNRVVQQGIRYSLQVFMTDSKGFGVRTLESIPKHSFVCEYAGEIIDAKEAKKRLNAQEINSMNYIYIVREYSSGGENCTKTIIDPTSVGNVGRFINHSCAPNLISVPIRSNSMIPKVCFFAYCDIKPLEELTYNYGGDSETAEDVSVSPVPVKGSAKKCLCGSAECLKYLPFSANLL